MTTRARRRRHEGQRVPPAARPRTIDADSALLAQYETIGFSRPEAAALAAAWKRREPVPAPGEITDPDTRRISSRSLVAGIIRMRVEHIVSASRRAAAPRPNPRWDVETRAAMRSRVGSTFHALIGEILKVWPSLTRDDFLRFARAAWPAARVPAARGRLPFSPVLIEAAHRLMLEQHENWGCDRACDAVAHAFGTSRRTIQRHLARFWASTRLVAPR
jgi:hypothetical protein